MRPERRSVPGLADEIADLEASLSADRSPRNVMRTAEALWLLQRPESALKLLRPLVRESPALVSPRVLLVWCLEDAGHLEEARARLDEVAALDPANPYAQSPPSVELPEVELREVELPAAPEAETPAPAAAVAVTDDEDRETQAPAEPDEELEPVRHEEPEPELAPDEELEAEPERALDLAQLREVPPGPLYSVTLAEIFAKQGFQEKAIEIYRRLESQDPGRSDLAGRIRALEEQVGGPQP
ncbi:MAG TPA: tetratricopeptide repeat protein [bacterium]|nr:tetratricopeptide repeat protein [bacterium]